jgi:hypothetical protein
MAEFSCGCAPPALPDCLVTVSLALGVQALSNETLDSDGELVWDLVP